MPESTGLASQVIIKLDGVEVQQPVMDKLASLTVDQQVHLPHMFVLRFNDPGLELLDNGPFNLAKQVEILAERADGSSFSLVKGEVTALEPNFQEGMIAELVVRGYDQSHRLYRETKSKAYLNIKDSDLASQIASGAGLQAEVDATSTIYPHLYQHNQTDLGLLMQRAWRIGYECFVSEGKLYFRRPPEGAASVTIKWGEDLLSFRPRMSLAEQVDEVVVKGWNPENKQPIVGRASRGKLYPDVEEPRDGAAWASGFGAGKLIVVDQPVLNQAEANVLAEARLNELSGAFIVAEGLALRRPDITAGKMLKAEALGKRFSGAYLVTNATHIFSAEGLRTLFSVRGARTGLLSEQVGGGSAALDRWPGLVVALVTNTDDPNEWGRVKLKFPWMSEDAESDWARVVGLGAGPEAGLFIVPEVGDEVIVAFLHGDFSQPVVLGGLWNGRAELPPEAKQAGPGEKPLVRTLHSIKGHKIAVYDNPEKKIEIVTADGRSITLSDKDSKIILKTSGVEIILDDSKVELKTQAEVTVKAGSNLKLEANGSIDIKANGQVNIKGALINLN
jgi:phage protein D/phage gp45-like